jgi:hypothetical protein
MGEGWHTEGDPKQLPTVPKFADGWLLGKPDLIVKPDAAYSLPAQQTDAFRIFAIRLPVTKRTYVTGIEFHPGNARVVHHANIRIDRTPATRRLDEADPLPGYDGPDATLGGIPGRPFSSAGRPGRSRRSCSRSWPGRSNPAAISWCSFICSRAARPKTSAGDRRSISADRTPVRTPTILRLGSQGIDIPPGDPRYVIRDSYVLPVDVQLLAVQPHAHYRAKEIRGVAELPDGTSRLVMHIKDWDFRWQHVYREETPIALPKGTKLSMEYTYDNSASNVRNPELPPARVFWGQRSRDEMGDLWFQLLAANESDRARMNAEITAKMTGEDIVGYETMLKVTPNDAELHDDVALLYLGLGFAANAVRHFQASATLKPESAAAHFNLGTALAQAGRFDDSIKSFRDALSRRPITRSRMAILAACYW